MTRISGPVIVDSSVWIEFLRATGSPSHLALRDLIITESDVHIPEVVMMELLSGPTSEDVAARRHRFLLRFTVQPLLTIDDTLTAAAIQRRCRRSGVTVRSMIDCLVAAVAMRLDLPVLHQDIDFDRIASVAPLRALTA